MPGTVIPALGLVLGLAGQSPEATADRSGGLSCPDGPPLEQRIEELLGRPVAPGEVSVHIIPLSTAPLRARLELDFEQGREVRVLEAGGCSALLDAAALLVAVTLDPTTTTPNAELESVAAPAPAPDSSPAPPLVSPATETETQQALQEDLESPVGSASAESDPSPDTDRGARRPARSMSLRGGGLLGGEGGAIPGGTGGVRGLLRFIRGAFMAELSGDYWIRRRRTVVEPDVSVAVSLGTGAVRACGLFQRQWWRVPLCGGAEAGLMRGEAFGLRQRRDDRYPWLAGIVSAGFSGDLWPRVSLSATVEGFVTMLRPRFEATTPDDQNVLLYVPRPVGGRLLLGITIGLFSRTERAR